MKNFEIKPIEESQLEEFNSLVGVVAREKKYLAFLDAPPMEMTREFVQEIIEGDWPLFVAVANSRLIGWCDISSFHRDALAHGGSLGIGVLSDWRGKGVGQSLMKAALQKARKMGLTRVQLNVRENNHPAISLYEKLGFKIEGLHINAIRIDGIYENEYTMALLLE